MIRTSELRSKNIILRIIITVLVVVTSVGTAVFANNVYHDHKEVRGAVIPPGGATEVEFWSTGSGTASSPYRIRTYDDLVKISLLSYNDDRRSSHYILVNDIEEDEYADELIDGNLGRFYGTLDGKGHTLSNFVLYPNSHDGTLAWGADDIVGLFSVIENATIKDLKMENIQIPAATILNNHEQYQGAIAGHVTNSSISQCSVKNLTIEMNDNGSALTHKGIGAIVGVIKSGSITNCEVDNFVIDCSNVDYVYNWTTYMTIEDGSLAVQHAGNDEFGSIVGMCDSSTVELSNCMVKNAIVYDKYRDIADYGTRDDGGIDLKNFYAWQDSAGMNKSKTPPKSTNVFYADLGETVWTVVVKDEQNKMSTTSKQAIPLGNKIGGPPDENSLWFKTTDYNDGVPVLRIFISWKIVTVRGIKAFVGFDSKSNAVAPEITFQIPSDANLKYSPTDAQDESIEIYGIKICSVASEEICSGKHGKFHGWTCKSPTLYEVEWEPIPRRVYLPAEDSRVVVVSNANSFVLPCGARIQFEYGGPFFKRDNENKQVYFEILKISYIVDGVQTTMAEYRAKKDEGFTLRNTDNWFVIKEGNTGDGTTATHKTTSNSSVRFDLHDDIELLIKIEPMTYSGGIS